MQHKRGRESVTEISEVISNVTSLKFNIIAHFHPGLRVYWHISGMKCNVTLSKMTICYKCI